MKSNPWKPAIVITLILIMLAAIGCGGNSAPTNPKNPNPQGLVDPSGNWRMTFVDSNSQTFLLSALFNQVGSVVSGVNFSEVGNGPFASPPTPFACVAQTDIAMANGLVQNVNQFSGDLSGNFGGVHFSSTLNDTGTHASGTYTTTPGTNGNCLDIALTGTFTGDEVPSMTGTWTGTVTCGSNCPTGFTSGTVSMALTQDDATGKVVGTYAISGVPGVSNGSILSDTNNILSGSSLQAKMGDANGSIFFLVGGPLNSFGTSGVGLDRSFHGSWVTGNSGDPIYAIMMSH